MTISKIIKKARDSAELTQDGLALAIGKSNTFIWNLESGKRPTMEVATLEKLCAVLNINFIATYNLWQRELNPSRADIIKEHNVEYSTSIEPVARLSLDNAQKQGIIPPRLPVGVVELIVGELTSNGEGSYTMEQVRNAYVNVRDSNPLIHTQCEICEAMCSPALSEQDLEEILAILQFKIDKKESNP